MYTSIIEFGTPQYGELIILRDVVLRKPLGLEFTEDQLAEEYNSIHLACYSNQNQLLACLVLKPLSSDIVKMRQVAVFPNCQKKGVGTFLVEASEIVARQQGYKKLVLSARLTAVPFYNRLEYDKNGETYTEVGIVHLEMSKEL